MRGDEEAGNNGNLNRMMRRVEHFVGMKEGGWDEKKCGNILATCPRGMTNAIC